MSVLPPHEWDLAEFRAAIHQAFDRWFLCYFQGNRYQAASCYRQLRRLIAAAEVRRLGAGWIQCANREVEAMRNDKNGGAR